MVGKAEWLPRGPNPRFVVTSLQKDGIDDRTLYEGLHCARGDMELLFRRLKGFRHIFSRFEKLDALFLGFVNFALINDAVR